jgi:hypothetical protein
MSDLSPQKGANADIDAVAVKRPSSNHRGKSTYRFLVTVLCDEVGLDFVRYLHSCDTVMRRRGPFSGQSGHRSDIAG